MVQENIGLYRGINGNFYDGTYTYMCPFCGTLYSWQKSYNNEGFEKGSFYTKLTCENCSNAAQILYQPEKRID